MSSCRNAADGRPDARPKGSTQMSRLGVAVLAKGLPLPAHCALIRNIWVALDEALSPIVLVSGLCGPLGPRYNIGTCESPHERMNADRSLPTSQFWSPRYWPAWLGFGLLWLLTQFPYRWQLAIGKRLGILSMYLSKNRRHIVDVNLRLCFPELTQAQRRLLCRRHFASLGISLLEVALGWWATDERLKPLANIQGLEHMEKALKAGKGVILLSAHLTSLELGGRLLAIHTPFHVMYRRHQNPLVEYLQRRNRETHFEKAIPREDVRDMLRSLRGGKAVWYAPDQNYGHKNSVFVPFFGIPAATNTGTARLARVSDALVLPFFPVRRADGTGYDLILLPPIEDFPSGDALQDTTK
jgi:KDO2-lipid IV(A) lauroyltransferase